MPYQPAESAYALDPFGMVQPPRQPLTEEDVAMAQRRLSRWGIEDSMMGRANAWRGDMVRKRDNILSDDGLSTKTPDQGTSSSALKEGAKSVLKNGLVSSL